MMAKWKGFTPSPELVREAAEYLVMLTPYGRLLRDCEVVVEFHSEPGRGEYRACVFLEIGGAAAGPVHSTSAIPEEALKNAFNRAKSELENIRRRKLRAEEDKSEFGSTTGNGPADLPADH